MVVDISFASPGDHFQVVCDRFADNTRQFRFQRLENSGISTVVTWQQVIALWQHSSEFRTVFTTALAQVPLPAFFWETPPITTASLNQPWECVTVVAPTLAQVAPDPDPFSRYLSSSSQEIISTFPNLGGDALLVVPQQQGDLQAYTHLANFLRLAPTAQVHRLWQVLGQTIQQHLIHRGERPLWVSTSGLGVYWLHVRLDDAPKYYAYRPYKAAV